MAKIDRFERLDQRRLEMEAEYLAALIEALKMTASGKWRLFGHAGDRKARATVAPVLENLTGLADEIDEAREQLAMPEFELHRQFLAAHGPVDPQAVGEAKQAQGWLDRLGQQRV